MQEMKNAHVTAVLELGTPFSKPGLTDFGAQAVTGNVRSLIPTMVRLRLKPPPDETYSLHRKLSGVFLLATKLGARVPCRDLLDEVTREMEEMRRDRQID
jgi:aarF domain-containing kinase